MQIILTQEEYDALKNSGAVEAQKKMDVAKKRFVDTVTDIIRHASLTASNPYASATPHELLHAVKAALREFKL